MSVKTETPTDEMQLEAFRKNNLEKLLRTNLKFTVTKYFVERWISILGRYPKGFGAPMRRSAGQAAGRSALVIMDMRQFTYWEQGKPVRISRRKLAERHQKSERTIQTIMEEPLVKWFVQKQAPKEYYIKNGQPLRRANKYTVRQDEPILPHDIEHLIGLWEKMSQANPERTLLSILEHTLKEDPIQLRAPNLNVKIKNSEWFAKGPLSVLGAIQKFDPDAKLNPDIRKTADLIQNAIIQPNDAIGATKYFREKWMPHLGAAASWLLLLLRSKGFLSEKVERNIVIMESSKKYADILGISSEQVVRMLKNDLKDWLEIKSEKKKADQSIERTIKVYLRERLTPEDEQKLSALYARQHDNEEHGFVAHTENRVPGNVACTETGVPQNVAHTLGEVPRNVAQIQIPLTYTSGDEKEHTIQIPPPLPQRQPDDGDDDAQNIELPEDLLTMLNKMGWNDTTTIIEKHYIQNAERVIEWAKYALKKSGLTNRAGYFRKRLASGEKAPKTLRSSATRGNRDRYRMDKYADYYD